MITQIHYIPIIIFSLNNIANNDELLFDEKYQMISNDQMILILQTNSKYTDIPYFVHHQVIEEEKELEEEEEEKKKKKKKISVEY